MTRFYGLLKFFREENFLNKLISGHFYCNTAETYRLSEREGVSDPNESCINSFRVERNDVPPTLLIEDVKLEGLSALTLHGRGFSDMWLHSWYALESSWSDEEITQTTHDINRMRKEFGKYYAFIPHYNLFAFATRLKLLTSEKVAHGRIRYSNNSVEWSVRCKSTKYSYQKEYRFAVGNCAHNSIEPMCIFDPFGFERFIYKNTPIQAVDNDSSKISFHLDLKDCYSNP